MTLRNAAEKKEVVKNFDHLAKLKFSPVNPTAFTERGLYMLATILKGTVATQTTINIINTFVEIRELSRAIARIPEVVDEGEKKSLLKRSVAGCPRRGGSGNGKEIPACAGMTKWWRG